MLINSDSNKFYQRASFRKVEGVIAEIEPTRTGKNKVNGCILFVRVEDTEGNSVNFLVGPGTYVLDFVTLTEGMKCQFFHRDGMSSQSSIYPPQYMAAVVAPMESGRQICVGYFDKSLINQEQSLQIRLESGISMLTTNNQIFIGSPASQNLAVVYETATGSTPAQATPKKVVVLCR
ncbi:MAG: hypothetical protein LBQ15_08070 [Clostridium sp.]|jgi:hypothetical protein|nr:hypothetical protein [Clostridium sp.]